MPILLQGSEYAIRGNPDGTVTIEYADGTREPHDDMASACTALRSYGLMYDPAKPQVHPVALWEYRTYVVTLFVWSCVFSLVGRVTGRLAIILQWTAVACNKAAQSLQEKRRRYVVEHITIGPPPF